MLKQETVKQIQQACKKDPDILAAYIFGSVSQGYAAKDSDLDVAVVVKNKNHTTLDVIYDLFRGIHFPKNLDLSVVDKQSSPLFLFEIIKSGQHIYEKDPILTTSFEAFALKRYYDTAHIRNIYYSYLPEKFSPTHHATQ